LDVREEDPEKDLETARSHFKDSVFIKSLPQKWDNPHASPMKFSMRTRREDLSSFYSFEKLLPQKKRGKKIFFKKKFFFFINFFPPPKKKKKKNHFNIFFTSLETTPQYSSGGSD